MRKRFMMVAVLFFLLLTTGGCGNNKTVYFEIPEQETEQFFEETEEETLPSAEKEECYVYVCGAVEQPGVYILNSSARVYEAIAAAGGLTDEANFASVNQAETVEDGQMIRILTNEEVAALETETASEKDGRIDINQASAEELMTLPGIGKAKADSIISYRKQCGGFSSIEEIMQVEGIKEGLFNRMKDSIKVK